MRSLSCKHSEECICFLLAADIIMTSSIRDAVSLFSPDQHYQLHTHQGRRVLGSAQLRGRADKMPERLVLKLSDGAVTTSFLFLSS